jgi:hypothetical protein
VTTNDQRFNLAEKVKTYEYLELSMSPVWIGPERRVSYPVSLDGGLTIQNIKK